VLESKLNEKKDLILEAEKSGQSITSLVVRQQQQQQQQQQNSNKGNMSLMATSQSSNDDPASRSTMSRLLKIIPSTLQRVGGVAGGSDATAASATKVAAKPFSAISTSEVEIVESNAVPAVFRIPVLDIVSIRIHVPFVELSTADGPLPPLLCKSHYLSCMMLGC
jgi:hypothetical protein